MAGGGGGDIDQARDNVLDEGEAHGLLVLLAQDSMTSEDPLARWSSLLRARLFEFFFSKVSLSLITEWMSLYS